MVLRFLRKYGPFWSVLVLTLCAVVASVILKVVIMYFLESRIRSSDIVAAAVIPAIIAPAFTVFLFSLVTRLSETEERLRRLATVDDLTQVCNRRHFMRLAEKAVGESVQHGSALAVLMLDVDRFKQINDVHGHLVGDEVLKSLADTCAGEIRSSDVMGRFGGEEFVFLLPQTEAAEAEKIAERIRRALAKAPVVCGDVVVDYTASVGVAVSGGRPVRLDELLKTADRALYAAKAQGRNRVVRRVCGASGPVSGLSFTPPA